MRAQHALALAVAVLAALAAGACSRDQQLPAPPPDPARDEATPTGGEPASYSATVRSRTELANGSSGARESRIARDGTRMRQEWTEDAGRRALIIRPDLGYVWLVDLDANEYVESPYGSEREPELEGDEIERLFPAPGAGSVVASERAGAETVAGHPCTVYASRIESLSGGVSESTVWEADDLNGLAVRSEVRSAAGRIITELADVTVPADPALFELPSDARPVAELRGAR